MERKLKIELVPESSWHYNLRSVLKKSEWEYIKVKVKQKSGGKCSICGKETSLLDAHEVWEYDEEKGVQKLKDVIAVCKDCHSVIHIGFTSLKGNIERAENHYLKVNNCTYAEYKQDLKKAQEEHKRRNKVAEWTLDISKIKDFV